MLSNIAIDDYRIRANVTLRNGTQVSIPNEDISPSGTYLSVGASGNAFPFGNAVCHSGQMCIDNSEGTYTDYDFDGARMEVFIVLKDISEASEFLDLIAGTSTPDSDNVDIVGVDDGEGNLEVSEFSYGETLIKKGEFTLSNPTANEDTIAFICTDDMTRADIAYNPGVQMPCNLYDLFHDVCESVGLVAFAGNFANDDIVINRTPIATAREMLGYISMLAGGNCFINSNGLVEIKGYSTGLNFDMYDEMAIHPTIGSTQEAVSKIKTMVYGVSNDYAVTEEYRETGNDDGVEVTISNPLLDTDNVNVAINSMLDALAGVTFVSLDATIMDNPAMEFMDYVTVYDIDDNPCPTFVMDYTWNHYNNCSISSQNLTGRSYTDSMDDSVRNINQKIEAVETARKRAQDALKEAIEKSSGFFETIETLEDGSTIKYVHNNRNMSDSTQVWKYTANAILLSTDGGESYPYGLTVDGSLIQKYIDAVMISADQINAGDLIVGEDGGKVSSIKVYGSGGLAGQLITLIDSSGAEFNSIKTTAIEGTYPNGTNGLQELTINGENVRGLNFGLGKMKLVGGAISDTTIDDLNYATEPGVYSCLNSESALDLGHTPITSAGFRMEVKILGQSSRGMQTVYPNTGANIFFRKWSGTGTSRTWTSWYKLTGTAV